MLMKNFRFFQGEGCAGCMATEDPKPKLSVRNFAWEVWLSCGSPPVKKKVLVGFGGEVVPVVP